MKEKLSTGDDVLKHLDLIEENAPPMVQLAAAAILLRDTNFPELIYQILEEGKIEEPCDKMAKAVQFAMTAMERVMANHIKENSKLGGISIEMPEEEEKEDTAWKMPENYRN